MSVQEGQTRDTILAGKSKIFPTGEEGRARDMTLLMPAVDLACPYDPKLTAVPFGTVPGLTGLRE